VSTRVPPSQLTREEKLALSRDLVDQAQLAYASRPPECEGCAHYEAAPVHKGVSAFCRQPLVAQLRYDGAKRDVVQDEQSTAQARSKEGACGPAADLFIPLARREVLTRAVKDRVVNRQTWSTVTFWLWAATSLYFIASNLAHGEWVNAAASVVCAIVACVVLASIFVKDK
jgi:hypothetical protein